MQSEAISLRALQEIKRIKVPQVIGPEGTILISEWIEQEPCRPDIFFRKMGQDFAKLHQTHGKQFGFEVDNHIGATPQINLPWNNAWTEFFIHNRLDFQMELLNKNKLADEILNQSYHRLKEKIPELLAGSEESPSLLHGDLWSGNFLCGKNQLPVFIDPACYYGHREIDLAMTRLFGGFPDEFYRSYQQTYPLKPNYQKRIKLYTLYHLLNHLNLFGRAYYAQSLSVMRTCPD